MNTPNTACNGIVARSPTIGDLAQRLAYVYSNLRNLEEAGWNGYHRFSFVALGQLTDPVRAAMAKAGVIVLPSVIDSSEELWEMKNGTGLKRIPRRTPPR